MTIIISNAAAQALADAFAAKANGGKLQIYDGTRPANPGTAVGSQVKLLEFTLQNPAFAASAMVGAGAAGAAAVAAGNVGSIAAQAGLANSTATWGRILDSSGAAVWDGDVGTAGTADFQVTTTTITTTTSTTLTSMSITQATGQ